jgi:heparan-alpha-glucosaminide N-acetyltransferase
MHSRIAALDAYRGLVLLMMMGEALRLCGVAAAFPTSALWAFACHHQSHVPWQGGSLHDLIQPSFSFLVGAALPFSIAARLARGQRRPAMLAHALRRALVLVALGIVLRSQGRPQTYFTFEDTLTQIGLGYPLLFLLGFASRRRQWLALALVLLLSWAAFALYPAPGPDFDWQAVGVPSDWPHLMTGFAAHWNKNENFSAQFDRWFLNLFPREQPFVYNSGGYQTLSFVPTLGTMILGLLAGGVLREQRTPRQKLAWLAAAGVLGIVVGWGLAATGVCPLVKRIWTPSFALWSGGFCFLLSALFYAALDARGARGRWALPLLVPGANSIAAYCLYEAFMHPIEQALVRHLPWLFEALGPALEPSLAGAGALLVAWLVLFWMWRRRIFVKI